jgi:hypothetical protein
MTTNPAIHAIARKRLFRASLLLAVCLSASLTVQAQENEAKRILKSMTDYMQNRNIGSPTATSKSSRPSWKRSSSPIRVMSC